MHLNEGQELADQSNGEWNTVGKNNRTIKRDSGFSMPSNNFYLSERGGVNIIYESDESEDGIQNLLKDEVQFEKTPTLISAAADLHPYNIIHEEKQHSVTNIGGEDSPKLAKKFPGIHMEKQKADGNQSQTDKKGGCGDLDGGKSPEIVTNVMFQSMEGKGDATKLAGSASCSKQIQLSSGDQLNHEPGGVSQLKPYVIEEEEYSDNCFEYEYDDLLVDDECETSKFPTIPMKEVDHILISEDPPFTEKDLEDFINNDPLDQDVQTAISDGTFHSIHNAVHSSSSFALELGKLGVHQEESSRTNSSKRKGLEGMEDTASSRSQGGKKSRT